MHFIVEYHTGTEWFDFIHHLGGTITEAQETAQRLAWTYPNEVWRVRDSAGKVYEYAYVKEA